MRGFEYVASGEMRRTILFAVLVSVPISLGAQEPATRVAIDDIGTKVTLVGRLGLPLGTMMEVRGTWSLPENFPKPGALIFNVSHVNGTRLEKPVKFDVGQIEAATRGGKNAIPKDQESLDGVTWTLRAYETGRFNSIPGDYWKALGGGPHSMPYWLRPFTSELVGVVQEP